MKWYTLCIRTILVDLQMLEIGKLHTFQLRGNTDKWLNVIVIYVYTEAI